MKKNKKLGEILIEEGLIDEFHLNAALSYQKEWGGRIGSIIVRKGLVSEKDVAAMLEKQLEIPAISLFEIREPSREALNIVDVDIARKFEIFPVEFDGKTLTIAMADPTDLQMLDDISFRLGVRLKPMIAIESDIARAIEIHYEGRMVEPADAHENIGQAAARILDERVIESSTPGPPPVIERTEKQFGKPQPEISQKMVIESIIDLLVEKGVMTREELRAQIRSKRPS